MNETNFLNEFHFNIFNYSKYHFTDNSKVPINTHYFGCLISGNAVLKTPTREISVSPGEVFYIPKGLKYQSRWYPEKEGSVSFYSFGFATAPTDKTFLLQKISCTENAQDIFDSLCNEIPFTEKGISKLYSFFSLVSDSMEQATLSSADEMAKKAIELITEDHEARMPEIAQRLGISESGLYLLFKKHFGFSPNEARHRILCDKAVALLTTTNTSVQEISDALGFSSTSYFRKILKKYTGRSPRELRKDSAF